MFLSNKVLQNIVTISRPTKRHKTDDSPTKLTKRQTYLEDY